MSYNGESSVLTYGGGWQKLLAILADDSVSELKVDNYRHGIFIIKNGINTPVDSVYWGNESSFFEDFEQAVFPSMHASGFDDADNRPIKPHKLRYLYEGALEYAVADSKTGQRKEIHARLHMVLKPIIDFCPAVTIAKRSESLTDISSMVANGTMNDEIADFLRRCILTKQTVIFSAGSGCGKTTMLRALGKFFDPNERLLVAEDSPELSFNNVKDVVYMQSSPWRPGRDANEVVTLAYIVQLINRMRGSRIIIGETRSKEFHGFIESANSGLKGGLTTFHANSPVECLDRCSMLDLEAEPGRDVITVNKSIAFAVDFIVQLGKDNRGHHYVDEITEVSNTVNEKTGQISVATVFKRNPITREFENQLTNMSDPKRRTMGYYKGQR